MKNNTFSVVYIIFLSAAFVLVPAFVIKRTFDMKSGWNGLSWGKTEEQIREWVKKNNTNYSFERCPLSHYGIVCWKLSWKTKENSVPFEFIEFQFKDGKLVAVIETEKSSSSDPASRLDLGRPAKGTDIKSLVQRENGIRFAFTERVFYYVPESKFKATKERYAVSRLVKTPLDRTEIPEEILSWRLTRGSYSSKFYEEISDKWNDFPSAHFF